MTGGVLRTFMPDITCLHLSLHLAADGFIKIIIMLFCAATMTSISSISKNYIFAICSKAFVLCWMVVLKRFTVKE